MEISLREIIKKITVKHLKKNKSQLFGQNLTGVGWVDNTLPKLFEKDGVIELPMADVAGGGIVTGSGLMGKRPIYIIRYHWEEEGRRMELNRKRSIGRTQ